MSHEKEAAVIDEISLYREDDEKIYSRSKSVTDKELSDRAKLHDTLSQMLSEFLANADATSIERVFERLKAKEDYFTQLMRDALHVHKGIPRKPKVVTWETRTPSNASGLDE